MLQRSPAPRAVPLALALLAAALSACSDGSDTDSTAPPTASPFELVSASIAEGDTVALNRGIDLVFTADVDIRSVSPTTVEVLDVDGGPVLGSLGLPSPRTVRFEPICPRGGAPEAGGLQPGTVYTLRVPAAVNGSLAVLDTAGRALGAGLTLSFETPDSMDPAVLYDDPVDGPPRARVVDQPTGNVDLETYSYVEFTGQDADGDGAPDRAYFAWDPVLGVPTIAREVPLNLYSQPEARFSIVLRFDQPVDGAASNLARVRLEHRDPGGTLEWQPLPAARALISNCVSSGAILRVVPLGVLPAAHELRVVQDAEFADLVGQTATEPLAPIGRLRVVPLAAGGVLDAIIETFDGTDLFDPDAVGTAPLAGWDGSGTLEASFDFAGTGGPGGDFDWIVRAGNSVVLNTDADTITGGPLGVPAAVQPVIGGLVQVRDFIIEPGATVDVLGSQPLTILATGRVQISGRLGVDGSDSVGVDGLNTTDQPELGATGAAGGGSGGTGSPQSTASSDQGGPGEGAFGVPGGGGEGGESAFANSTVCGKEFRRGAGGGGGRLGPDVRYEWNGALVRCQTLIGLDAERGIIGSNEGTGAVSQSAPAQGGSAAPGPFLDGDEQNDFLGIVRYPDGTTVRGELTGLWAGSGGGGGGDASSTSAWPLTPFNSRGDEKGAGGGGGAGGLQILAVGDIEIDAQGSITADGGNGNGGENAIFYDRIGGGSGGGSGGHVVLASAGRVVLAAEANGPTVGAFYADALDELRHERRPIRALGGQGGAGRQSRCGANEEGPRSWVRDSIPIENFEGDPSIPPQDPTNPDGLRNWALLCTNLNVAPCASPGPAGETFGAGGDGGPGLIQIHVENPATDIVLGPLGGASGAYGAGGDPTFAMAPPPLGWSAPNDPIAEPLPIVGRRSEAVTRWLPLGLARTNGTDSASFLFGGTDPATGAVLRDGNTAAQLTPLVEYTALGAGTDAPSLDLGAAEFAFPNATELDPSFVYRRNPALMRGFAIRLRDAGSVATAAEFVVQSSSYDGDSDALLLRVDPRGEDLADIVDSLTAPEVELIPFFVRLTSGGELDAYPPGSEVRVLFDAARIDPLTGETSTDPADVFSGGEPGGFTPDITDLNQSDWDVLRIRFEFLLGTADPTAPRPAIDFVRVPFMF